MNPALTLVATLAALHLCTAHAAGFDPPREGWASWEIPAVADAPASCCYEAEGAHSSQPLCKLDGNNFVYGSRDNAKTDAIRIYARFVAGKPERLRALSADCPVQTRSEIRKLSPTEQVSVEWLASLLKDDVDASKHLRSDIISALAVHRSPLAYDVLARIARLDTRLEVRRQAVFWLAQVRGREGANLTRSLMFEDSDPRLREHAAFALTQSVSPQITEDLIRLATTDHEGNVRSRAWFWLAHTESPQTEHAIEVALRQETDHRVREQAVFALSQLPQERATPALISVAENRDLPKEERKKAIFWLAQGGSDAAMAYLDKVLSAAAKR